MRTLSFLLFIFSLFGSLGAQPCRYSVITHPYTFSTYYEMIGDNGYEGRAIKEAMRVQTTYDLYDAEGDYVGQGACRILSLGAFYAWAREIDVYDVRGKQIGFIDGKFMTTARTKYNFYDQNNCLVGIAYNNNDSTGFILVDPSRNERMIGTLKRVVSRTTDDWDVVIYEPDLIDMRLIKIFSAFVADYQDYF